MVKKNIICFKIVLDLLEMIVEASQAKYFFSQQPFPEGPYGLSMLVSNYSLSYSIFTSSFNTVVELCHIDLRDSTSTPEQFTEQVFLIVQNYALAQKKYEKINITFLNQSFNTIPEAFAADYPLKSFLKFSTGTNSIKTIATSLVGRVKFLYSVNIDLLNYFEKVFVNATFNHAGAINIALLFNQHSLSDCNIFLNIHEQQIELAIKEKHQLEFYNVFNFSNNEDILYYLLFTMEQFELNPLHAKLVIAAQIPASNELIASIKKYVKQVSFCVHNNSLNLTGDLLQLPQHYYFTLLNQHSCEL